MIDQRGKEIGFGGDRKFQHDLPVARQRVECFVKFIAKNNITLRARCTLDIHFWLDHRHEAVIEDLCGNFELLLHNGSNSGRRCQIDNRAHLGAKHPLCLGPDEQRI